ncbi:MAG: adenylate/guanylate cyclase domain-containing protein [Chloroflexi bacterium]|nr:adenylate/guanylate cyclase domain-containing protein [Chloroflexota bacterium]
MQQEITVLFADVRGFTSLAEKMPLHELSHSLNLFFDTASKLLIKNDALVDKFLGDAVMALFNAPIPRDKHRETALVTAIALQERVTELRLPFDIGIGINTGVALTGHVGLGEVTDYTATGDAVNVASRLADLAGGGEILAGLSTCEGRLSAIPAGYTCEEVTLHLEGKELAVEAYRIHRQ